MAGPFKMKGSPFQRNFGIGSPAKTHNTGYDDQYRLIRLPDVTEREKKDHAASIEREENLTETEKIKEEATDKKIREDNQKTFEENQKKEEKKQAIKRYKKKQKEYNELDYREWIKKYDPSYLDEFDALTKKK